MKDAEIILVAANATAEAILLEKDAEARAITTKLDAESAAFKLLKERLASSFEGEGGFELRARLRLPRPAIGMMTDE